jgi:hypothetical protein
MKCCLAGRGDQWRAVRRLASGLTSRLGCRMNEMADQVAMLLGSISMRFRR